MKVDCWACKQKLTVLVIFTKRIEEIASFQLPGNVSICSNNETTSLTAAAVGVTCDHAYSNSLSFLKTHLYAALAGQMS